VGQCLYSYANFLSSTFNHHHESRVCCGDRHHKSGSPLRRPSLQTTDMKRATFRSSTAHNQMSMADTGCQQRVTLGAIGLGGDLSATVRPMESLRSR
jgi:hypothetical protein